MSIALCCMSHSPMLRLPGPSQDLLDDVDDALEKATRDIAAYDPDLVVIFAPDHYNGFFYNVMPPFCVGVAAKSVGDYGSPAGPLDVPEDIAYGCIEAAWTDGLDVAVSANMQVDHGAVQPLERLFGGIANRPVVPIFIN